MIQWCIPLLYITLCALEPTSAAVDATLQPKANGVDVVRATVRKIRNSCIFPDDFGLLLRIALVESNFGRDPHTFRDDSASGGKGIWQMDRIGFDDTKLVSSSQLNLVKSKFGIDWTTMTYSSANMNKPLYNALAARLLLYRKPEAIPAGLDAQAAYWKQYYNTALGKGTVEGFISKVTGTKICSTVGADLLFILDASGSIGSSNFKLMKQVLVEVAKKFTIGPAATQIAVLTFSTSINERINFASEIGPLTTAINALSYTTGGTNTHLALNEVVAMFQLARNLNKGFPRVVIVLTDGASSSATLTRKAAEGLNAYRWLERYAVGMGSSLNNVELNLIASACSNVYRIPYVSAISALTDELYDVACRSSVALPPPEAGYLKLTGTLPSNTQLSARDTTVSHLTGRTYALQVQSGSGALYVSLTMENPSSAINDYSSMAAPNSPGVVFVSSTDLKGASRRRKRDLSSNSSANASANIILYLSIVPTEDSGSMTYQLNAHDGDHRTSYVYTYRNSAIGRQSSFLWLALSAVVSVITSVAV